MITLPLLICLLGNSSRPSFGVMKSLTIALLLLFSPVLHAQNVTSDSTVSGEIEGSVQPTKKGFVMAKSPLGAVLRSAILPGWGQYYTESYWKIPLILGVSGFLVYGIVSEHQDYARFRDAYAQSITDLNPSGELEYKRFRELYRDRRDTYAWYFGLFYLLQVADAFVDAHLFDFSVSSQLKAGLQVSPAGQLCFRLTW